MEIINKRIASEFCKETHEKLLDKNLLPIYLESESVKQKKKELEEILKSEQNKNKIIENILYLFIPAGTKGVIRGLEFNKIVKEKILSLKLDKNTFKIEFEKEFITHEKPDWYIQNIKTEKCIIGMNQIDLWGGGHQTNRGSKYIFETKIKNGKLLCVVCSFTQFKNNKVKAYKLFEKGFADNTICFVTSLEKNIKDYLEIV